MMKGFFKSQTSTLLDLSDRLKIALSEFTGVRVVAIASLVVSGFVLGVRHLGGLQLLELVALDQLVRLHSDPGPDPRLLVVGITEGDIRTQKQWPLSDRTMAQLLAKLQSLQPQVIGLDVYREIPQQPGNAELKVQLREKNIFAIKKFGDTELELVSPPPGFPEDRVGFNDLLLDPDGVVRRNLLFVSDDTSTYFSFSLRLAIAYLESVGITPESSQQNPDYIQLAKAVFVPLQQNSGGYHNIDPRGYQVLLNYRSSNVARQVTLTQVLKGQIDPNWVKNKIVLIGTTAPSAKDTFSTPYSPAEKTIAKMPGVLVHAQMVSQFLDAATGERPLFWFWDERIEVLWIVGWTLLGAIAAWWLRHPVVLILGCGVGLGVLLGTCFYLFTLQGWVPLSAPVLGFILTSGVVITYRSYDAQQQQQIIMKLLGQNTSPEVAKALWKGRDRLIKSGKLPGIKLIATMMFADIKDFSTIAEQMPPEALLEWLNEMLDVVTHEIIDHEGIINKFTGDGFMAVFGVPMDRIHKEEVALDAQRSIECALAIGEILEELNQNWKTRGLPVIQMRIGIFTGPVVVGSLGGKDRLEYGVIGDSVNTAARLESCEKHRQPSNCRVLIGKETLVHLDNQFLVESWGPLPLKGKQQMVDVYLVVGRQREKASEV
ncbi:adenylate/guanylate cyclase domain-containing protein [Coleofasciculus sp. FACHB-129]|uniref:CHASE2 domain-containing protein n=1 Tax=Cyanophyceae TaxID=3028117 RepID=UPI001F54C294|nr:adenylate/guanylate cyclase domain-containing protein [Coleofasciculus sp. FACHB-129]